MLRSVWTCLQAIESSLRSVNLWDNGVADKQCRKFSGGMKRRLSVAISLIGNPQVVSTSESSLQFHEQLDLESTLTCTARLWFRLWASQIGYMWCNLQVVYMDKPITGLDPASRYNLWSVVKQSKQDRAIILTSSNFSLLCSYKLGASGSGIWCPPPSAAPSWGSFWIRLFRMRFFQLCWFRRQQLTGIGERGDNSRNWNPQSHFRAR